MSLKRDIKHSELLSKYLAGNLSDDEKLFVDNWKNESTDNQALFDDYTRIWTYSASNVPKLSVNVDEGWEALNRKIAEIEKLSIDFNDDRRISAKRILRYAMRVAAVLVIAIGLLFVINRIANQAPANVAYVAAEINTEPLILDDGSEVLLNKGAEINYPETFSEENRAIIFCGEAFFNIAKNANKPFIIDAGEVRIEVLGTSFNLVSSPDCDKIVLYLESGKVRFSSVNPKDGTIREQLILMPGQKGVYNKASGMITKSQFENKNHMAWKTGILEFEKTPLNEVMRSIEQTYKINVVSDKSLENLSLTARFDNETPESIFKSIQTIFGIEYEIDGDTVLLN